MSIETFDKDNLDNVLKTLAKEYKKLAGKSMPAELVLVGGAAIIENYGFRDSTTDIDAMVMASSAMKEAIIRTRDVLGLSNGWLNDNFKKTKSYSTKIREVSVHYKSFYGVLNVRTVSAEYLVAMKLRAGRRYKNDLSDVAGILAEHRKRKCDITFDEIDKAVVKLYDSWKCIPKNSVVYINDLFEHGNYEEKYAEIRDSEKKAKRILLDFEEGYPETLNIENANDILSELEKKSKG